MARMTRTLALTTLFLATTAAARAGSPNADSDSFFETQGPAGARRNVREVPRREEGQRRAAARLARGDAGGRRERPGGRAGRPAGQPARPGGPPRRRDAQDAARASRCPAPPRTTWPPGSPPARPGRRPPRRRPIEGQAHWAFEPLRTVAPPEDPTGWASQPIDRLIAAGHRAKGLHPVARADRRTLIRRAYFDLIGLPPEPERVEAFVGRRPARRLRAAGRRAARLAPLRRALGPLLARPRPLCRHRRATTPTTRSRRRTSIATT